MSKLEIIPMPYADDNIEHPYDVAIANMQMRYTQMQDNNSPINRDSEDQYLTIETVGADICSREDAFKKQGYYYVIKTDRWAFDDIDDLIKILQDFKGKLYNNINSKRDKK